MRKRFLSFEDLYSYFENNGQNVTFSAKDDDASIVVHIDEPLVFDTQESDDNKMIVNLKLCHTLKNLNMSYISKETMQNALPTAYNMPILGYIWEDEDGVAKFAGHEFYMDDNDEIIYEEQPIGCIPESGNLRFVESEDEGDNREYVACSGIIWRTYSKAAEIMEREKDLSVSIEIDIDELSYIKDPDGGKNGLLNIKSFSFDGVTILQEKRDGSGQPINPGMSGACITLEDFSKQNNSIFSEKICEKLAELNEKLDKFANLNINYNTNTKGGEQDVTKFEELLKKYAKTEEDITFEIEGLSDEELEKAFAEAFESEDGGEDPKNGEGEDPENSNGDEPTNDDSVTTDDNGEGEGEGDGEGGEEATFSKTFELSHSDIKSGLYTLLVPFEEADNDWYVINAVYDDYFIYEGIFDVSHLFKQNYTREDDEIQFSGERIHMNAEYLTDNELAELTAMRSNYAEISEKLAKYEAEPQKVEKIQSEEYSMIRDTEEFKKIESEHFDLSVEQIGEELDKIVLSYAKAGKVNFAKNEEPKATVGRKVFGINTKKTNSRYGSLFNKDK